MAGLQLPMALIIAVQQSRPTRPARHGAALDLLGSFNRAIGNDPLSGRIVSRMARRFIFTSLRFKNVYRVDMQDGTPGDQQTLFSDIKERLRDIRTAPDRSLISWLRREWHYLAGFA